MNILFAMWGFLPRSTSAIWQVAPGRTLLGAAVAGLLVAPMLQAQDEITFSYSGPAFTAKENVCYSVPCVGDSYETIHDNPSDPDRVFGYFTIDRDRDLCPTINECGASGAMTDIKDCVVSYEFSDGRQTLRYPIASPDDLLNEINAFNICFEIGSSSEILKWYIQVGKFTASTNGEKKYSITTGYDYTNGRWGGYDRGYIGQCFLPSISGAGCQWAYDTGRVYKALLLSSLWTTDSTPTNEPPVADAGDDQNIRYLGQLMELDGTASHDDNTPSESLLYRWSFESVPEGSTATLSNSNTSNPSFTADSAGAFEIELVVTDEGGLTGAESVIVSTENLAPTADAGDDALAVVGYSVSLNGSESWDPEGFLPLAYAWTMSDKPYGSEAALTLHDTATPSFTPDLEGLYTAELIVSDDLGASFPDSVEITAVLPETNPEEEVVATAELVGGLSNTQVTTKGNQRAFLNFLSQALLAIQIGDTEEAIKKLEDAISRTDGCVLREEPDGNGKGRDWITDCGAQETAYDQLTAALEAISP